MPFQRSLVTEPAQVPSLPKEPVKDGKDSDRKGSKSGRQLNKICQDAPKTIRATNSADRELVIDKTIEDGPDWVLESGGSSLFRMRCWWILQEIPV